MYMVVSRWEIAPGREEDFEQKGKVVRGILRSQPGVVRVEGVRDGRDVYAIHCYESEQDYNRIVQDPNGPFAKAVEEHNLDGIGTWIHSVRGPGITD